MQKSASDIVKAYFQALSAGDESALSRYLWEDFKGIDPGLETHDKPAYLAALRAQRAAETFGQHTILDLRAIGNIVQVITSSNALALDSPIERRVFALVDDKIKLEVRVA
jgi:hypothetical protein